MVLTFHCLANSNILSFSYEYILSSVRKQELAVKAEKEEEVGRFLILFLATA